MKILYLTTPFQDYLSDSLLIGLKGLVGITTIDHPRNQFIYQDELFSDQNFRNSLYGKGFTLYNHLAVQATSGNEHYNVFNNHYDLIVFSSIHNQFGLFSQLSEWLKGKNVVIVDGSDSPAMYPYGGKYWRSLNRIFLPRAHTKYLYFKREWIPEESNFYRFYKAVPKGLCKVISKPQNVRGISFSIPGSKVVEQLPVKKKDFVQHIVDPEVSKGLAGTRYSYVFSEEGSYYEDIQSSRFGITMKKAGWDCMRHYEIAANGAVMCFRDLEEKPLECAPFDLVDGQNCISYSSFEELKTKIAHLSTEDYIRIQAASIDWARRYSSENVARRLLEAISQELRKDIARKRAVDAIQ